MANLIVHMVFVEYKNMLLTVLIEKKTELRIMRYYAIPRTSS